MGAPWWEAGHNVTMVDTQHAPGEVLSTMPSGAIVTRIGADLRTWRPGFSRWDAVFAFPPCTEFAQLGSQWWPQKDRERPELLRGALGLVRRVRRLIHMTGVRCWFIENPVGRLARLWRPSDYRFQPHDYGGYLAPPGDAYTKRTCLWVGPGFVMPPPRSVEPVEGSKMHRKSGTDKAGRSLTPAGFARAVFEANGPCLVNAVAKEAA